VGLDRGGGVVLGGGVLLEIESRKQSNTNGMRAPRKLGEKPKTAEGHLCQKRNNCMQLVGIRVMTRNKCHGDHKYQLKDSTNQ